MASIASLTVDLNANIASLRRDLAAGQREFKRFADRSSKSTAGITRALGEARLAFGAFAGVLGLSQLKAFGQEVIRVAGRMQALETRIGAFVGTGGRLDETMRFINETATRQGKELFTVAEGYARLLPLVDSNIISMSEARKILTGFNDVAARTGATSAQLGQTMFGLAQGLSAGTLRAEELNQITEPLPGLLQALDRASGLAAGGFRRMVVEGKVTSEFFRNTLIVALQDYTGAAEEMAQKIEGASARIANAWTRRMAKVGEGLDVVLDKLADFLEFGERLGSTWERETENIHKSLRLKAIDQEIADLQDRLANGNPLKGTMFFDADAELEAIESIRAKIAQLTAERLSISGSGLPSRGGPPVPGGIPRPTTSGGTGPDESIIAAAEKRIQKINAVIAALQFEGAQLRRTTQEQEIYVALSQAGITAKDAEAQQIMDLVTANQAYSRALEAVNDDVEAMLATNTELFGATRFSNELLEEMAAKAKRIWEDTRTPLERYNAELEELNALLKAGAILQDTFDRATDAAKDRLEESADTANAAGDAARELGLTFSSAFEDAVVQGEDLRSVLQGLEQDILRILTRKLVTEPLTDALGGIIDGMTAGSEGGGGLGGILSDVFGSAKGNVFGKNGGITPFAKGGIISGPTMFPMPRGIGLAGEAGAEAILPLDRDSSGNLGVRGGGGANVTINLPPAPNGFRYSPSQLAARAGEAVRMTQRLA